MTDLLDQRASGVVSLLGDAARSLDTELQSSLAAIERTLAERGQTLISEFQTRAEALDTGAQKLNAALEARARQINDTLLERGQEISGIFREGQDQIAVAVEDARSKLDTELSGMVTSTSAMLDLHASDFASRLDSARATVADAFGSDLGRLSDARAEMERAIDLRSREFVESHERVARRLGEEIGTLAASREAMEDLKRILEGRAAFYSKADLAFNTSAQPLEESFAKLRREVRQLLKLPA